MNLSLCIGAAMDWGQEVFVFGAWGVVNLLGVVGLVMLTARKYLVAGVLGGVPLAGGMTMMTLTLCWHGFSVVDVMEVATRNTWVVLFPGIPLVLGLVVLLLAVSGRSEPR